MRIAFLPSSYLPHSVGGTEIYVHHLSEALARMGHEVAVAYHAPRPAPRGAGCLYEAVPLAACPPRRRTSCGWGTSRT